MSLIHKGEGGRAAKIALFVLFFGYVCFNHMIACCAGRYSANRNSNWYGMVGGTPAIMIANLDAVRFTTGEKLVDIAKYCPEKQFLRCQGVLDSIRLFLGLSNT